MFRKILFILLVFPTFVYAQTLPPVGVKDEGGSEAKPVFTIDCVGSNIACTHSGSTMTITESGAGGSGDSVTVNTTATDTTANLKDDTDVTFTLTDGGAGGPDDVKAYVVDDSHNHVYSNIDATTSTNWASRVQDETGSGQAVFNNASIQTGVNASVTLRVEGIRPDYTEEGLPYFLVANTGLTSYVDMITVGYSRATGLVAETTLQAPYSASPTVDMRGLMGIDSDLITQGMLQVYLKSAVANVVATTDTPGDNEIPTYDAAGGTVQWEAAAGAEVNNLETVTTDIAVNEVPTGTGANTVVYKLIPDCNVAGSALAYEDTTQTWSCRSGFSAGGMEFAWNFPVQSGKLPSVNPPGIDAGNARWRTLFDDTTKEAMSGQTAFINYNSGTLKAAIEYSMVSASADDVVWRVQVMCITEADATDVDTTTASDYDTPNTITDTVPAAAGRLGLATITLTNSDSCANGDLMIITVDRDAGITADDASGDAELRAVTIYED